MDRFQRAVLALAQSAKVQSSLFPDFVCKGDELALDFEEGLNELSRASITDDQWAAVEALDKLIISMSGEKNVDFWTDEMLLASHPKWEAIRSLAQACATSFGWQMQTPPVSGAIYIAADR